MCIRPQTRPQNFEMGFLVSVDVWPNLNVEPKAFDFDPTEAENKEKRGRGQSHPSGRPEGNNRDAKEMLQILLSICFVLKAEAK